MNSEKLGSMPYDKIINACDIHAKEYKRLRVAGNQSRAEQHKTLMHVCVEVALEKQRTLSQSN